MSYSPTRGDTSPPMEITAAAEGSLMDAASVQLRWQKPDGTISMVALEVIGATSARRIWEAGDLDQAGHHRGQLVVTDDTGKVQTISGLVWVVEPQLGDD